MTADDAPLRPVERALDADPPLELGGWAVDRPTLEAVLAEVASGRDRVVECGSGTSTVAIARLVRALGAGHVWALEHDPGFASRTRAALAAEGLSDHATVIDAPLRPHPLAVAPCGWYDAAALAALPDDGVGLLFVDGPPAPADRPRHRRSRYPALPALADRLAAGATVICDDAARPGERWALERWEKELGVRFEHSPQGFATARGVRGVHALE